MFKVIHPPSCAVDDEDNKSYSQSISGESLRSFRPNQFGMIKIAGQDGYFHANTKGKNKMLELILNQEQCNKQAQHHHNEKREETESLPEERQQTTVIVAIDDDKREQPQIDAKSFPESETKDVRILDRSGKGNDPEPVPERGSSVKGTALSQNITKKPSTSSKRCDIYEDNYIARSMTDQVLNLMKYDDERASRLRLQLSTNPSDTSTMTAKLKRLHQAQLSPSSPENACQSPMSILSSSKKTAYSMVRRLSSFRRSGSVKPSRSSSSLVLGTNYTDAAVMMLNTEGKSCLSPSSVVSTRKQMSMKRNRPTKPVKHTEPARSNESSILLTRHQSLINGNQRNFPADNSAPRLATFLRRHRSANPSVSSRWSASNTTPLISNACRSEKPASSPNERVDVKDEKCRSRDTNPSTQVAEHDVIEGIALGETADKSDESARLSELNKPFQNFDDEIAETEDRFISTKVSWMDLNRQIMTSLGHGEPMSAIDDGSMKSCKSVMSFLRSKRTPSFRSARTKKSFKGRSIGGSSTMVAVETLEPKLVEEPEENRRKNLLRDRPVVTDTKSVENITETPDDQDQVPSEVRILQQDEASILSFPQQSFLSPKDKQEDATGEPSVPPTPSLTEVMSETSLDRRNWADLKNELEKKLEHNAESSSPYQKQACRNCGFDFSFGKCFSF